MKWLIWKDFRVNRVVFITAMVLLIASHLLVAILAWRRVEPNMDLAEWFAGSSFYSLVLLQLAFALLGGNSIAGERVDRSAEFLSYLPVSRGRILASKLLVSLAAVPLIWLPNLAVLATAYAARSGNVRPHFVSDFLGVFAIIGITGLTFFCVAWLLSCVLLSPTYSVSAGLITPLLVATGVCWVEYLLGLERGGNFVVWCYGGLCLVISAASFLSGTIYYLRRAEP